MSAENRLKGLSPEGGLTAYFQDIANQQLAASRKFRIPDISADLVGYEAISTDIDGKVRSRETKQGYCLVR